MGVATRLLKKPFFGRYQKPWRWPEGVRREGWERVEIASESGARLVGLLGAAEVNPVRGAVLLAHPIGLPAKGFWLKQGLADVLRAAGYHVLAFDFNGFGESESGGFDFPADAIAAGTWLRERFPPLPRFALGASFGAGWTLCAMARAPGLFHATVLEAVFPTLPYYWKRYPLPFLVLRATQLVYPAGERMLRPIAAAAELRGRPDLLLIFGEDDAVTPPEVAHEFERVLKGNANVELWLVPGAGHVLAYATAPDEYRSRVLRFFDASRSRGTA
jgi:pimeloyl-ACP methyl ester carboxylesterase